MVTLALAVARGPAAHARTLVLARAAPRPGVAAHAPTAARARAGLARADCARAEGIRGALRRPAASAPLVARVPPEAPVLPVVRALLGQLLLQVPPAVLVPPLRAGTPPPTMEAGVGRVARRLGDVRMAAKARPIEAREGPRVLHGWTRRAGRAGPMATGRRAAAGRQAVRGQRGPGTAAGSAEGVSPHALSTVTAAPRAPAEPNTVIAAPRVRGLGTVLAEAKALAGAKALLAPPPVAAECNPAMVVNRIGLHMGAPSRVGPTIAGPLRAVPGAKRRVPAFPRALLRPLPVAGPLRYTSRGSPGCVFPIPSPPSS